VREGEREGENREENIQETKHKQIQQSYSMEFRLLCVLCDLVCLEVGNMTKQFVAETIVNRW
jgi:hypothetical protein